MYLIIKNYIFTKEKQSSKKHIKNLKTSDIMKKNIIIINMHTEYIRHSRPRLFIF